MMENRRTALVANGDKPEASLQGTVFETQRLQTPVLQHEHARATVGSRVHLLCLLG